MDNKARGSVSYLLVYAELIRAARYHGTVTYQDLAELIGLPLVGSYMGKELGGYLGTISLDEVKLYNRPMLSALCVTVSGKPGEGFFGLAKELGKLTSDDPADKEAFWEAEKQAVYKTWQHSFNTHAKA
jgi:hypothetical protein